MFAGIDDHLHSTGLLSRLKELETAEDAVWRAIKDTLESMGEIIDALNEPRFRKITPKPVFVLSSGYVHLPYGQKFVYAKIALLSDWKCDVIIPAPNREVEARNLIPLRSELPAVWSDISNAMRGFKGHSLRMLVLDEVLGLELSNFSRQPKLKPGIDDDHQVIVGMSNDLWFRGVEFDGDERSKRQKAKQTKAHVESMVLRKKLDTNQLLYLTPRMAALDMDAFERGPTRITNIHAYLVRELNLSKSEGKKSAEFIDSMGWITLEAFWI